MAQEPLFAPEAAAVAGELRAGAAADDAVAGHDDGDGVAAVGGADGAHGLGVVDGVGDGLVAGGLAVVDAEKLLPDWRWKGVPSRARGRSKQRKSPAK